MAYGFADDLPSTLVTATDAPIMVAPAMNDRMWMSDANQQNLKTLAGRGVEIVDPGSGYLACGTVAEGRLAEPEAIVDRVLERLDGGPLRGKRVLVTAGGTREPIDAVRWVGNHSSGRMGIAIAKAAHEMGAEVRLLLGPTEIDPPQAFEVDRFTSTADLRQLLNVHAPDADAVIMSAAVSDWKPARTIDAKLKKEEGVPTLELEPTEDLIAGLAQQRPAGQFIVGFALESGDDPFVEDQAKAKLERKRLDMICGNRADVAEEGFGSDTNRLYLYDRRGRGTWTPRLSKAELGRVVLEHALEVAADESSAESAS